MTHGKEKVSTYPGKDTHGKEKRRGLDYPGDCARGKEKVSTCPGKDTHEKEKRRGLDFPGDFVRGKEKIMVSTYPGKESPREGEGLNMLGRVNPREGEKKGSRVRKIA